MKNYNTFGVMIDMSRNAVMSLDGLRRFFTLLKKMGYNCVFLYTEGTYEVDGEPGYNLSFNSAQMASAVNLS